MSFRHWADYHPVTTSLLWRGGVRAGGAAADRDRAAIVRFEDIVARPDTVLRSLSGLLDVEFEPDMLEVKRFNSSVDNDRAEMGVDGSAVGRWQDGLSTTEKWVCQRVNAREMHDHGYDTDPVRPSAVGLAVAVVSLPAKLSLAFALNVNRTRNLVQSMRIRFLPERR